MFSEKATDIIKQLHPGAQIFLLRFHRKRYQRIKITSEKIKYLKKTCVYTVSI